MRSGPDGESGKGLVGPWWTLRWSKVDRGWVKIIAVCETRGLPQENRLVRELVASEMLNHGRRPFHHLRDSQKARGCFAQPCALEK